MNHQNPDGTANLEHIRAQTANLKAKYAQGMANYERNTGKAFHQAHDDQGQGSSNAKGETEISEDSKVNQAGEKKEL